MICPVTITEASAVTRKLQKDRSQRYSMIKDSSTSSSSPTRVITRARSDSVKQFKLEGSRSTSLPPARSSFDGDRSLISVHPAAPHSLRIHTKGALLTSSFAYHPGLFDLKVHPIMWEKFTGQIVDTARLSPKERAKVWAVGTAAAVTISSPDSYHIGRNKMQRYQEEKVKEGLIDESEDSLGDLLRQWNEGYFAERGLLARLELCEAAQNSSSQRSKIFQREAHWYPHKEDRERVRAKRKFSLVITQMYKREELAEEDMKSCLSGDTKLSIDSHGSEYPETAASSEFKPLPDLPIGAEPLLDIVTEFTNLECYPADQLPPATQVAELEVDNQRAPLLDQEAGLPGSAYEHRDKKCADRPKIEPLSKDEAQDWPLKDATDGGNYICPAQHAPLSRSRDERVALGLQEHDSSRSLDSNHLDTGGLTIACGLQLSDQQNVAFHKPSASPTASFFMPLEFKPVSNMLDFDPKLVLQDVAIAH